MKKQLGTVPNPFRLVANSPAAREGYLGLSAALGKGTLPTATRERMALAVAEINERAIAFADRKFLWPRGPRPADHPGLGDLGL